MLLNGWIQGVTVAPDPQADVGAGVSAASRVQADLNGLGLSSGIALGVVQQVDENAAQVFGVKPDPGRAIGDLQRNVGLVGDLGLPVTAYSGQGCCQVKQLGLGKLVRVGSLGNMQDVMHRFLKPLCVLLDQSGQLLLFRVGHIFGQQGIGLHNGRQRVANFMGYCG